MLLTSSVPARVRHSMEWNVDGRRAYVTVRRIRNAEGSRISRLILLAATRRGKPTDEEMAEGGAGGEREDVETTTT